MQIKKLAVATMVASTSFSTFAADNINISSVINVGYTERDEFNGIAGYGVDEHAAGLKQGFWVDHTELTLSAPIDDMFYGKVSLVLDEHDGATEIELEEAFVQTIGLDYGLSLRVGRFLSNVGYLNNKHAHTDSFADRPLVYRAFLNDHYYDDGVRVSWVAPTDLYLEIGSELFKGGQMPAYSDGSGVGATSLFVKTGGDINEEQSWQLGVSYLGFDNDKGACSAHDHGHEEDHAHEDEHEAEHEHEEGLEEHFIAGACDFSGKKDSYLVDFVWKWAPDGNYKYQNLTFAAEYFWVKEDGELGHHEEHEEHGVHADEISMLAENMHHDEQHGEHHGYYVSGVYQFSPNWAAGLRYSEVDFDAPYSDGFRPSIATAMVEYRHSHFSTVRWQFNQDKSVEEITDNQVTLQFSMVLGDHSAHQF
ncbi:hypothetical protein [Thalassotalea maritima]|uniref:hypothetical protein n=1 Tax=Thalassotalea maritima TaxID=3242416 RepID=UPI00352881DE